MNDSDILTMTDAPEAIPSREWLTSWLTQPPVTANSHTLVLGSCCRGNLERLGNLVSGYLNEHDSEAPNRWHAFSLENLRIFAGNPGYRNLILAGQPHDTHLGLPDSDIDRITRRLARHGGAVLEGQFSLDASNDLTNAFRVCLCGERSPCGTPCQLMVDPQHFSRSSLIIAIGDSFLDWASRN